jgi:hypothetical protein
VEVFAFVCPYEISEIFTLFDVDFKRRKCRFSRRISPADTISKDAGVFKERLILKGLLY